MQDDTLRSNHNVLRGDVSDVAANNCDAPFTVGKFMCLDLYEGNYNQEAAVRQTKVQRFLSTNTQ